MTLFEMAILVNFYNLNKSEIPEKLRQEICAYITNSVISTKKFKPEYFSSLRMIWLYCLLKQVNFDRTLTAMPILFWNKRINLDLVSISVFMAIKYKIFKYNPLLYVFGLYFLITGKFHDNLNLKSIWFVIFSTLKIDWPLRLAQKRWVHKSVIKMHCLFEYIHISNFRYSQEITKQVRQYYSKPRFF